MTINQAYYYKNTGWLQRAILCFYNNMLQLNPNRVLLFGVNSCFAGICIIPVAIHIFHNGQFISGYAKLGV